MGNDGQGIVSKVDATGSNQTFLFKAFPSGPLKASRPAEIEHSIIKSRFPLVKLVIYSINYSIRTAKYNNQFTMFGSVQKAKQMS